MQFKNEIYKKNTVDEIKCIHNYNSAKFHQQYLFRILGFQIKEILEFNSFKKAVTCFFDSESICFKKDSKATILNS